MSGISQTRHGNAGRKHGEIVGKQSEVYRDMMRAFSPTRLWTPSGAILLDALPGDVRQEIAQRVRDMVEEDGEAD